MPLQYHSNEIMQYFLSSKVKTLYNSLQRYILVVKYFPKKEQKFLVF